jgi:hypothetical protein
MNTVELLHFGQMDWQVSIGFESKRNIVIQTKTELTGGSDS